MITMGLFWMSRSWNDGTKNIIIDTIPLMLFLIGLYNPEHISKFKRLSCYKYTSTDFEILKHFLINVNTITITPGVLSEVSNFLENDDHFAEILKENYTLLDKLYEKHISKDNILKSVHVSNFGFTDTSILIAAKEHNLGVLTRDYKLANICRKLGLIVHHLDDSVLSKGHLFLGDS